MKRKTPDLSIVVPAYREARRIEKSLRELANFLNSEPALKDKTIEVIVVAADSPDKTKEIVAKNSKLFDRFQLITPGARTGKGRDVKVGMLATKGQAVVFMDADLATPLSYLPVFLEDVAKGYEVVYGTRNLRQHHPEAWRRSLSIVGNVLFRLLGGVWTEDSQCGFKMFNRQAAQICFSKMRINEWGFDMEILTIARINHFKMKSYRIEGWKSVPGGSFSEGAFRTSLRSLAELAYIFWGRLTGRYRAD